MGVAELFRGPHALKRWLIALGIVLLCVAGQWLYYRLRPQRELTEEEMLQRNLEKWRSERDSDTHDQEGE